MYGNTEGQTGCCWHSILRLWEGDRRFEIKSCKRPQGEHDWPGYHSRLMWYSSRWELQAHSLKFPLPGGRWGCEGLSEDKATLWAGKGPPAVGMDAELSKHSQGSARRKNRWCSPVSQWKYPKTKEHWTYPGQAIPPGLLGRACYRLRTLIYAWLKTKTSIYGKLEVSSVTFCKGTKSTCQKLL